MPRPVEFQVIQIQRVLQTPAPEMPGWNDPHQSTN